MKKILITGADGQLGKALIANVPEDYEIIAANRHTLDITDQQAVFNAVAEKQPQAIINAAAYTAVDKAESEPELAVAINTEGPRHLARAAKEHGIKLVHVSTDFVFDGRQSTPYKPEDKTNPLSVYGKTKEAGEKVIQEIPDLDAAIIRTAWVYDGEGPNFLTTMLRLMTEKDSLGVVADQIGTPTYVGGLAGACWCATTKNVAGMSHWTDAGVASWYDFAIAIQEEALAVGLLEKSIPIFPLTTDQYPTPAVRPAFSVLDSSEGIMGSTIHWRKVLRSMINSYVSALKGHDVKCSPC